MNPAPRALAVLFPALTSLALAGGAGAPPPHAAFSTPAPVAPPAAAAPAALATAPTDFLAEDQVWEIEFATGRVMRFQLTEEIFNDHSSVHSSYLWLAGLSEGDPYGALILSGQRTLLAWVQGYDVEHQQVCFARIGAGRVHEGLYFSGTQEQFEAISANWDTPTATNDAQMWQQYSRDLNTPCTLRRLL